MFAPAVQGATVFLVGAMRPPEPGGYLETAMSASALPLPTASTLPAMAAITPELAERYRALYNEHVKHPGHWKDVACAVVPASLAQDVRNAMDFMGSVVDWVRPVEPIPDSVFFGEPEWCGCWIVGSITGEPKTVQVRLPKEPGFVRLYSKGYWAHGF